LSTVITLTDTVLVHAIENNFTRAPLLGFYDPVEHRAFRGGRFVRVARVPVYVVVAALIVAVNAEDDTL
jgi:hypothetical protein